MSDNKRNSNRYRRHKTRSILKWANVVSSGEAKHLIAEGCVKVNGEIETKGAGK